MNKKSKEHHIDHRHYDNLLTEGRRVLWNDPVWRQGPERARAVASEAIDIFLECTDSLQVPYMEIGSGPYSPLGVSTVMYLNGVESTLALDITKADFQRSAEALYDLLASCALEPEKWNMSGKSNEEFMQRIRLFDIQALKNGDLLTGVKNTDLHYVLGSLENMPLANEQVSLVSSRATLEHILNFQQGMKELFRVMRHGGVAFHSVDLVDHRVYREPDKYNMWSFLTEETNPINTWCNRLRADEILKIAEKAGFETHIVKTGKNEIPIDILNNLHPRYAKMDIEDLKTTNLVCVFYKK